MLTKTLKLSLSPSPSLSFSPSWVRSAVTQISLFFLDPSATPAHFNVSKIDSTKVNVHWDPVDPSTVHGEFKEYRVSQSLLDISVFFKEEFLLFSDGSVLFCLSVYMATEIGEVKFTLR